MFHYSVLQPQNVAMNLYLFILACNQFTRLLESSEDSVHVSVLLRILKGIKKNLILRLNTQTNYIQTP